MTNRLNMAGWNVYLSVDDDGHLGVYISHDDGTEVHRCRADIGEDNEWADRFTTQKIEDDYEFSQEIDDGDI